MYNSNVNVSNTHKKIRNCREKTSELKTRTQEVKKPERAGEYERKYKELWESAEDILFLTDLEGNIIEVNRAGRELFGYEHKKLNVLDVVDEKYRPLVIREIRKL
ncbi:MAG: PAS domain S-box protein [Archaeoglobus sp.]|nr:PAS domain S-box protein [Archaeoglobus sp.]